MTSVVHGEPGAADPDLTAAEVAWDIDTILPDGKSVDDLLR